MSAIPGNTEASLTWNAVPGAESYILYRRGLVSDPYVCVARTAAQGYGDRNLGNGTTYHYAVATVNADGRGDLSPVTSVVPTATVLRAPTAVTARAGNGQVTLTWGPVVSAVGYNVYRATSMGGPYALLTPPAPGLSFTDSGLANGARYYYVVQTRSSSGGAYSDEAYATPLGVLPESPANLTAAPGSTWAKLDWDAVTGASGYLVYRGYSLGGPYQVVAAPTTNAIDATGLVNGNTSYFRIAAVNANGQGALSEEAGAAAAASEMPHETVLDGRSGIGIVYLSWDVAIGAVSYTVHRSLTPGGPYENLGVGGMGYPDYDVVVGTTYYYVVRSHNAGPTTADSNEVAVTPVSSFPAPSNVVARPGNTQTVITWDPVPGVRGYGVRRGYTPGGPYSYRVGTGAPRFTDSGLTNGKTYYYVVQILDHLGNYASGYSAEANAVPEAERPLVPAMLEIGAGNTSVSLTWTVVSGATGYRVDRRIANGDWSQIAAPTTGPFTDTGLVNGTTYYYAVAAVNAAGPGGWSGEDFYTPSPAKIPAPTNSAALPGNTQTTITWDPVPGVSGYGVRRGYAPGGPYAYRFGTGAPGFTDSGLTNGTTYYYVVQTLDSNGNYTSAFSPEVNAAPEAGRLPAPTNLGTAAGNTSVSLAWTAVPGATGYLLYRRTVDTAWAQIAAPTIGPFTDTGLDNGTIYYYVIAAVNAAGFGARSGETSATPAHNKFPAPVNVVALPGNTQTTITWDPVLGASGYSVSRADAAGGPYSSIGGAGGASAPPSFTDSGRINGTTYYYVVQSRNYQGNAASAYSPEVNVVPSAGRPLAPTNLGITAGAASLSLTWTAVSGATGYLVYRRTADAAWSQVAAPTDPAFTDAPLVVGTIYYYAVAAENGNGSGAWSGERSGTPLDIPHVTISASVPNAAENPLTSGRFVVARTAPTIGALSVYYTVSGTATPGSDYTGTGASIAIPAGATSATITVTPIDDTAVESDESVIVTLSEDAAYTVDSPAGATVTIASDDIALPSSWIGSVSINSDRNVVAVGRPHIGEEVASYDGFPEGALSAYLPMLFKNAWGAYNSAFYVQNVHDANTANLTIEYYNSAGTLNCTVNDTVAPLASNGYWVPSQTCLPDGWVGAVVVTSDQPVVAIGRPHIGDQIMSYDSFASGSLTSYLPMLFKDAFGGSYDSAFYVQNVHAASTANITINFHDAAGALSCTKTDDIAPLAAKGYWLPAESCLASGWVGGVVVTSDRPIVTVGRPHIGAQITTYDGFSAGDGAAYIPMLFKGSFGGSYNSAFYVQNVNAATMANLVVKYYDSTGALSCTVDDTLAALASKGYWVPGQACLSAGWVGGVVVNSDQPIVTVGRPHIGEQVTAYNGFASGGTNYYLPMLFKAAFGGSYNSALYIQNTEASTAAVTIRFYDSGGALTCTRGDTIPALANLGLWLPSLTCAH